MTDDYYTDYTPNEPEEELDEDQLAEDAEIDRQVDRFYDGDED